MPREYPTAEWTLQQRREALPGDREYKFLPHDRHNTFSLGLDEEVALGYRSLEINATCADGECFLRTTNRKHPSRVFELCDTAE
jgi:hypothetical protein